MHTYTLGKGADQPIIQVLVPVYISVAFHMSPHLLYVLGYRRESRSEIVHFSNDWTGVPTAFYLI